jgi:hypothetical protein
MNYSSIELSPQAHRDCRPARRNRFRQLAARKRYAPRIMQKSSSAVSASRASTGLVLIKPRWICAADDCLPRPWSWRFEVKPGNALMTMPWRGGSVQPSRAEGNRNRGACLRRRYDLSRVRRRRLGRVPRWTEGVSLHSNHQQ